MAIRQRKNEDVGDKPEKPKAKKKSSKQPEPSETGQLVVLAILLLVAFGFALRYAIVLIMGNQVNELFDDVPLNLSYSKYKWGSHRPGVYFGMKAITPESLTTGLIWFDNKVEHHSGLPIRHECNLGDNLPFYSWIKHDFDSFGTQKIVDKGSTFTTSFVIHDEESWSAFIKVERETNSTKFDAELPLSLLHYISLGQETFDRERNDTMEAVGAKFPLDPENDFIIRGWAQSSDYFEVRLRVEDGHENVLFKSFLGSRLDPPLLNIRETILHNIAIIRDEKHPRHSNLFVLRGEHHPKADNFIAHQVLVAGSVTLRIDFARGLTETSTTEKIVELQDVDIDSILNRKHSKFDDDFERIFRLKNKGFSEEEINFAQGAYSNMIGGIGYFHGSAKVASGQSDKILSYGPLSLLTAVPSRPTFPRGFLWDEGFHQLLVSRTSPSLSVNIITSWMSLMNKDGWIPREAILGPEAESRVPEEFVIQRDTFGNPPTLLLAIESLLNQGSIYSDDLTVIFPRLQSWFSWFNRTQLGPKPGTYTWRGRNPDVAEVNPKTLTSGLDDFPRASHPDDQEYHVDLRCWMAFAARIMTRISGLLREESNKDYEATAKYLSSNDLLDQLHWSEQHRMYADYGLHSSQVELSKKIVDGKEVIVRVTKDPPVHGFVPEEGYVSLFPLLLEILQPKNPRLGILLDKIEDPKIFWTNYGLRSLSPSSTYYKKWNTFNDRPYWRSNIWIGINYLALKSLDSYGQKKGPYQEKARLIYSRLRKNIIDNLFKEFKRTGFIWENYDDDTGRGGWAHPFTGWSSLVVLAMAEKY